MNLRGREGVLNFGKMLQPKMIKSHIRAKRSLVLSLVRRTMKECDAHNQVQSSLQHFAESTHGAPRRGPLPERPLKEATQTRLRLHRTYARVLHSKSL